MQPLPSDTSPDAQRVLFQLLRGASASEKLRLTCDLIQTLRKLVLSDLSRRFPEASEAELRRRLISRLLSPEDVIRAYGFDPKAEGY
jgi:hypothetical protein